MSSSSVVRRQQQQGGGGGINVVATAVACRHDETVRRVLESLFPEYFSLVGRIANERTGGRLTSLLPPPPPPLTPNTTIVDSSSPRRIRRIVARAMRPNDTLAAAQPLGGDHVVEVTLSSQQLSSPPRRYDERMTRDYYESMIVAELLEAVRQILANQQPAHPPLMDGRTCRNRRLPPSTVRLVEHRYWYRTLYWLCDLLTVICEKFTIVLLKQPPPPSSVMSSSLVVPYNNKLNVRLRSYCLRWRVATLLRRQSRRCVHCVHHALGRCGSRFMLKRRPNSITKIIIACEFVRAYRRALAKCTRDTRCDYHRDRRSLEQYERAQWSSRRMSIDLYYEGMPIRLDRLTKSLTIRNVYFSNDDDNEEEKRYDRVIFARLGKFACDLADNLWRSNDNDDGTVRLRMTDDLFETMRLFPAMLSLLRDDNDTSDGCRGWPRVRILYNFATSDREWLSRSLAIQLEHYLRRRRGGLSPFDLSVPLSIT